MAKPRRDGWQADLSLPSGQRLRYQFKTKAQAEAWEAAGREAIEAGNPVLNPNRPEREDRDLTTIGALFIWTKKHSWLAADSGRGLIRNGQSVVDFFTASRKVASITPADLEQFAYHLAQNVGNSPATVNRKLAAASKMFTLAVREGVIKKKPTIEQRKVPPKPIPCLNAEEEARLLHYFHCTSPEMRLFCMFLIDTGARAFSEAAAMQWKHISRQGATFWDTKADLPRTVPLSDRARDACTAMRFLKPNSIGPFQGLTTDTIRARWDTMRKVTGLNITPHALRHTCASRFVMAGIDVLRVQKWLGHKSLSTTLGYAKLGDGSLDSMAELLNHNN